MARFWKDGPKLLKDVLAKWRGASSSPTTYSRSIKNMVGWSTSSPADIQVKQQIHALKILVDDPNIDSMPNNEKEQLFNKTYLAIANIMRILEADQTSALKSTFLPELKTITRKVFTWANPDITNDLLSTCETKVMHELSQKTNPSGKMNDTYKDMARNAQSWHFDGVTLEAHYHQASGNSDVIASTDNLDQKNQKINTGLSHWKKGKTTAQQALFDAATGFLNQNSFVNRLGNISQMAFAGEGCNFNNPKSKIYFSFTGDESNPVLSISEIITVEQVVIMSESEGTKVVDLNTPLILEYDFELKLSGRQLQEKTTHVGLNFYNQAYCEKLTQNITSHATKDRDTPSPSP